MSKRHRSVLSSSDEDEPTDPAAIETAQKDQNASDEDLRLLMDLSHSQGNANVSVENRDEHSDTRSVTANSEGTGSLFNAIHDASNEDVPVDTSCPAYYREDFATVCPTLRNMNPVNKFHNFPKDIIGDEGGILTPSEEYILTMDGVSKCFRTISMDDPSFYTQPCDGYPFVFVSRTDGISLPMHIRMVLFFFYRLSSHIQSNGMTGYVIPTDKLDLQKNGLKEKKILGVTEKCKRQVVDDVIVSETTQTSQSKFSMASILKKRQKLNNEESFRTLPPLQVRVGYTGVTFRDDGGDKQELFCVCIVTYPRNFNILGYILDVFLLQPKTTHAGVFEDWNKISHVWNTIWRKEANENCGVMGDPVECINDPGGELGVFTLSCLLSAPLRMADVINRAYKNVNDIKIIGVPDLSYEDDETMEDYCKYMQDYISEQTGYYQQLVNDISVFYKTPESERHDLLFPKECSGGIPMKFDESNGAFLRFGVFKFPIMMWFKFFKYLSLNVDFESFNPNIGKLPALVEKKGRDFLTWDRTVGSTDLKIKDEHVLKNYMKATPLRISDRYYGSSERVAHDIQNNGRLLPSYQSIREYIQWPRDDRGAMSPAMAMKLLERHWYSCFKSHEGMLLSGEYRSDHLEQAYRLVTGMKDTRLGEVDMADYVNGLKAKGLHPSLQQDPFMGTMAAFMTAFLDINRDFALNALNLECLFEIMMSSVHYNIGSHSPTFVYFFQCVMIMSARGHLNVQQRDAVCMDWRKPNSSGAGTIQDRINKLTGMMGDVFNLQPNFNFQNFDNTSRFTPVGLENSVCVEQVGGNIINLPPTTLLDKPQLMTEVRKLNLDSLIQYGIKRDPNSGIHSLNTVDPDNSNKREVTVKTKIAEVQLCCFASNVIEPGEAPQTISVVTHVMAPGAHPYHSIEETTGDPTDIHCEM